MLSKRLLNVSKRALGQRAQKKISKKSKSKEIKKSKEKLFKKFRLSRSDRNRFIEEYFVSLDSAVSLSCLIMFRHGEFTQLVQHDIDPLKYEDPYRFRDDFAAISFLRKNQFLDTGIDKRKVALDSFSEAEASCKATNLRIRNMFSVGNQTPTDVALHEAMRQKINMILGSFDIEEFLNLGSWGPGVTASIRGTELSASKKFCEEREITRSSHQLFGSCLKAAFPHWFTSEMCGEITIRESSVVMTVPKNAKTDRTIAIEPGLNSYLQKAIGKLIRRKLRNVGYNLDSDFNNRNGALIGSLNGLLSTVDFSSASDTISRELVKSLFPDTWFTILDSLRSRCYELDGSINHFQKFSAMGNGFTFELESLIFVSAALVVCERLGLSTEKVSVFGDDIILPVQAFPLYHSFCKFLGFTVNQRKSYSSGYFRESCGSYFFNGVDVKPFFLKKDLKNAQSIYRMANSIRRLAHSYNSNCGCARRFLPVWKFTVRRLPSALRCLGPLRGGDGCIHANLDESNFTMPRNGWEGYMYSSFLTSAISVIDESSGHLNAMLQTVHNRPSNRDDLCLHTIKLKLLDAVDHKVSHDLVTNNRSTLRGVTRTRFKNSSFTSQWYNFGPWC